MTFLSCLAIGIAFLLAVGLLIFAAVLLGWYLPGIIERGRRAARASEPSPMKEDGPGVIDPPGPGA